MAVREEWGGRSILSPHFLQCGIAFGQTDPNYDCSQMVGLERSVEELIVLAGAASLSNVGISCKPRKGV